MIVVTRKYQVPVLVSRVQSTRIGSESNKLKLFEKNSHSHSSHGHGHVVVTVAICTWHMTGCLSPKSKCHYVSCQVSGRDTVTCLSVLSITHVGIDDSPRTNPTQTDDISHRARSISRYFLICTLLAYHDNTMSLLTSTTHAYGKTIAIWHEME